MEETLDGAWGTDRHHGCRDRRKVLDQEAQVLDGLVMTQIVVYGLWCDRRMIVHGHLNVAELRHVKLDNLWELSINFTLDVVLL